MYDCATHTRLKAISSHNRFYVFVSNSLCWYIARRLTVLLLCRIFVLSDPFPVPEYSRQYKEILRPRRSTTLHTTREGRVYLRTFDKGYFSSRALNNNSLSYLRLGDQSFLPSSIVTHLVFSFRRQFWRHFVSVRVYSSYAWWLKFTRL